MKTKISLLTILFLGLFIASCEKYLEPEDANDITWEELIGNPRYAEGFLLQAYKKLPSNYNLDSDVASDDAVTNNNGSTAKAMATGGWTSSDNPVSEWKEAYEGIYYINRFLDIVEDVEWSWRYPRQDVLYRQRLKGEAYALRAFQQFRLLKAHAGPVGGTIYGYPISLTARQEVGELNLNRGTYQECLDQIMLDIDSALANLPMTWVNFEELYDDLYDIEVDENSTPEVYDSAQTIGFKYENRINGLTTLALRSRVALYAASPAYAGASSITWQKAAEYAAELIAMNTIGMDDDDFGLDDEDLIFWLVKENKIKDLWENTEIIWNSVPEINKSDRENSNFPPSLGGNGNTNPSQSLIDAFPMKNGYPITDDNSEYVDTLPYEDRDPRLELYVLFNGAEYHDVTIETYVDGKDGVGSSIKATLTGYYLKKLLNEVVEIRPGEQRVQAPAFYTHFRFTEALLNFAEAANEVAGPDGVISGTYMGESYSYSARQVINALRDRVKIKTDYTENLAPDQGVWRNLIRNERRIELCFEGHRFWDLRRWQDPTNADLGIIVDPVKGIKVTVKETDDEGNPVIFDYSNNNVEVEQRLYKGYMVYGPIPYDETLRLDISQNEGWK